MRYLIDLIISATFLLSANYGVQYAYKTMRKVVTEQVSRGLSPTAKYVEWGEFKYSNRKEKAESFTPILIVITVRTFQGRNKAK